MKGNNQAQHLYAVHVGSNQVKWYIASDEVQALKIALPDFDKPEIIETFDVSLATKPREFAFAKEQAQRKLERKDE